MEGEGMLLSFVNVAATLAAPTLAVMACFRKKKIKPTTAKTASSGSGGKIPSKPAINALPDQKKAEKKAENKETTESKEKTESKDKTDSKDKIPSKEDKGKQKEMEKDKDKEKEALREQDDESTGVEKNEKEEEDGEMKKSCSTRSFKSKSAKNVNSESAPSKKKPGYGLVDAEIGSSQKKRRKELLEQEKKAKIASGFYQPRSDEDDTLEKVTSLELEKTIEKSTKSKKE